MLGFKIDGLDALLAVLKSLQASVDRLSDILAKQPIQKKAKK